MGALSRRKGADGERAVVNFAADLGIPSKRVIRTATSRDPDEGDVHLWDGEVVAQVKCGAAAQSAGRTTIYRWMAEAYDQAARVPQANMSLLVVQDRGIGLARVGLWSAYLSLGDITFLYRAETTVYDETPVRLQLGHLLRLVQGLRGNA